MTPQPTRPPFYPYRSEQAKSEYAAYCEEQARTWPVPEETRLLDTPSGTTFVRMSGRATDPPLVLLPGARVGSHMWADFIRELSARHRTYALDVLGDAGQSVSRRRLSKFEEFDDWLVEVLGVLVPDQPAGLVGVSLGGAIAAQYAVRHPGRLRSLVLVAPGATVLPMALGFVVRLTLLSLPMLALGRSPLRSTLRWLFADAVSGDAACRARADQAMDHAQRMARLFAPGPPPWPKSLDDAAWRSLRVPCLFLVGEHEKIYSARAAVRRLQRVAPQVKAEMVLGAGHDLTIVHPDVLTRRALEFIDAHEQPARQGELVTAD